MSLKIKQRVLSSVIKEYDIEISIKVDGQELDLSEYDKAACRCKRRMFRDITDFHMEELRPGPSCFILELWNGPFEPFDERNFENR